MENQEKADSYFNKKIDYKMERGNRIDEMIAELGEYLYQKYSGQIFLLKFYEDSLCTHT